MYPISLVVHDILQESRKKLGLELSVETERLSRPLPFDAGGAYDQSAAGHPLVVGRRTHSRWMETKNIGTDQWKMSVLEIKHTLFARPVVIHTILASSQEEVFSRSEQWVNDRNRENNWQEVVTRPPDKTPRHFSCFQPSLKGATA